MLRLPEGMTIKQYLDRSARRRKERIVKRKLLAKQNPDKPTHTKTGLRKILDGLFSFWIKLRDKRRNNGICFICKRNPIQVVYHFVPKCTTNLLVRWLDDNACGACAACNNGERWHRQRYREKHIELIGLKKVEEIEHMGRGRSGMTIKEMLELRDELKAKIAGKVG